MGISFFFFRCFPINIFRLGFISFLLSSHYFLVFPNHDKDDGWWCTYLLAFDGQCPFPLVWHAHMEDSVFVFQLDHPHCKNCLNVHGHPVTEELASWGGLNYLSRNKFTSAVHFRRLMVIWTYLACNSSLILSFSRFMNSDDIASCY